MTITPPLIPEDPEFNKLANKLARSLSTAFGCEIAEAERHVCSYYYEYEKSIRERAARLKYEHGVEWDHSWTTVDHFFHEDQALVLEIGYRLAGGDTSSLDFLEWRKSCWEPLSRGERVPSP